MKALNRVKIILKTYLQSFSFSILSKHIKMSTYTRTEGEKRGWGADVVKIHKIRRKKPGICIYF